MASKCQDGRLSEPCRFTSFNFTVYREAIYNVYIYAFVYTLPVGWGSKVGIAMALACDAKDGAPRRMPDANLPQRCFAE